MTARQYVSARHGSIAVYVAAGQFALYWFALCHLDVLLRPLLERQSPAMCGQATEFK